MKKLVPAMEKIDKIFNYLYLKERASQAEISRDLSIPKATTNRLLYTLVSIGYVSQSGKEYTLGNKFDYFSNKNENYNLIKNVSYPYLEELSLKFKETFKVSVFDKNKIRVIASVESNDYYKITVPENAIFPLHAGAASKILICQLTEKKLSSLLPEVLPKYTENTITNRDVLKKELFKVNIKKIAFDNMEHSNTISAVATPIYDKNNKIIAAVSCPFFSSSSNEPHINEIIKAMKEVCNKISEVLQKCLINFNFFKGNINFSRIIEAMLVKLTTLFKGGFFMDNMNLVFQMNKFVGDLHVFKAKVHNFHWNLVGEHFFVIHPMLDGIMSEIDEQIDSVAERLLMAGHRPHASLAIYLKHTVLSEIESKPYCAKEAVNLMLADFKVLLAEINIIMKLAEKEDNQATLSLMTDIAALYQKHIWMFGAWLA